MKKHYRHIDVLKGICITIVCIEHAKWPRSIWLKGLFPFWDRIAIPCFMVISGYVYSKSIEGKTLPEACQKENIIRKLKRYLIPFLTVFILESLIYTIVNTETVRNFIQERFHYAYEIDLSVPGILKTLIIGGYGPGNYYTPVLMQLVFLFPFFYMFMKRYEYKGLIFSFIFTFLCELGQYYLHIPRTIWRNLILRHIMTICFGIYLSLGLYKKNKLLNLISLLTGFAYIIAHSYYKWTPVFFNNGWADVNLVACLFFCPIIAYFIQKEKIRFKPFELIGKASYHIYLTQMFYYNFVKRDIMIKIIKNPYLWCLFSLMIIIPIGLSFYQIEKKLLNNK